MTTAAEGNQVDTNLTRRALLRTVGGSAIAGAGLVASRSETTPRARAVPRDDSHALGPPASLPTFYVANSGSDTADGLSEGTPWATIQKANSSLPSDGAIILFNRGDTFFGELNLPFGCQVGSFGSGPRPILTMYKLLDLPHGWRQHSENVWKIDLSSAESHGGYTETTDSNIGFLVVDGAVRPALKFDLSELQNEWDFYCDVPNSKLFVRASANPATISHELKAAPNGNSYGVTGTVIYCQQGANDISNIHITGAGGCGIRGNGTDVRIRGRKIDNIGGSRLENLPGNVRYGNGIENWPNVSRWTIENNEIANVYDVAWSPQGRDPGGGEIFWEDMVFRNNYIHDCGQTIELWSENRNSNSPGFVRILFEGNVCERAGYGAFSDVRPDQQVRVHLLTYRLQTPVDITIESNVFDDAYTAYSYHAIDPPAGYVTRNNTIRLKAGTKIQYQRGETVEQFAGWQASTRREAGSTVSIIE